MIYTIKKPIKKSEGLPAGAVVPVLTKTVTVHSDEQRLSGMLATSTTPRA